MVTPLWKSTTGVGRILNTIRNNKTLANNTFVFFTSDNGAALVGGKHCYT